MLKRMSMISILVLMLGCLSFPAWGSDVNTTGTDTDQSPILARGGNGGGNGGGGGNRSRGGSRNGGGGQRGGHGPGDGTGNGGNGPGDCSGNGPGTGDCING